MEQEKPKTDSWDDFVGKFIKVEEIKELPVVFVVKGIDTNVFDNKPTLSIETEFKGKTRFFGINKTNREFLKNNGIGSPKSLIGKTLTFGDKVKVRNPKGEIKDSLLITKVE